MRYDHIYKVAQYRKYKNAGTFVWEYVIVWIYFWCKLRLKLRPMYGQYIQASICEHFETVEIVMIYIPQLQCSVF